MEHNPAATILYRDHGAGAYHHAANDNEWRPARGLPEGAVPVIGSVSFAIAALDDDRAIVVWPTREDGRHGSVRALFIE